MRKRRPSPQAAAVFAALVAQPSTWRHGYDLSRETGLSSGTLYPLLVRLHDAGLLEAEWRPPQEPGRPARHVYRLTKAGAVTAREVVEQRAPLEAPGGLAGAVT